MDVAAVVDSFRRNGLINFSAAISFQLMLALVPFLLFLLDDTVTTVLTEKQGWWLSAGLLLALVAALAIARFVPLLVGDLHGALAFVSFVARWLAAAVVLGAGVALVMHYGPATRRPVPWVTFGTVMVMTAWVAMSILFGVYVTYVASYASVFGHLATFFVLLLYVYASVNAFLAGVQVDACVRGEAG